MTPPRTRRAILQAVLVKLDEGRAWTRGSNARRADGTYCSPNADDAAQWCLAGAQTCIAPGMRCLVFGINDHPEDFNDAPTTTWPDVKSRLEAAIAACGEEG